MQSVGHNNSFKPTPHRGVNSVLYATLHAVATPLWGGLTPALARMKILFAILLLGLASCSSARQENNNSATCISDEQIASNAEKALQDAKARSESDQLAPQAPEDNGKSPSQLAQEAASEGMANPCDSQASDPNAPEIPQIN